MKKYEIRWIDAYEDEDGFWAYNETRHIADIEAEDDVESMKEAVVARLRECFLPSDAIAAGAYKWQMVANAEPFVAEIVLRKDDKPLFCVKEITD